MIIVQTGISIIRWNILEAIYNDCAQWWCSLTSSPEPTSSFQSSIPGISDFWQWLSVSILQIFTAYMHICHICAKIFINRELDLYSVLTFDTAVCQLDQVDVLTVHGCLLASAEGWDGDRRYVRRGQSSAGNSRLHDIDADNGQEMGIDDHWSVARWECSISRHRFKIYNVWR